MPGVALAAAIALAGDTPGYDSQPFSRQIGGPTAVMLITHDKAICGASVSLSDEYKLLVHDDHGGPAVAIARDAAILLKRCAQPVVLQPRAWLCLRDGQRMAGESLSFETNRVFLRTSDGAVRSATAGELAGLFFDCRWPVMADLPPHGARVVSRTGDVLQARRVQLRADKLIAELDAARPEIPWVRVAAVLWSQGRALDRSAPSLPASVIATAPISSRPGAGSDLVELRDGSRIAGHLAAMDNRELVLKIGGASIAKYGFAEVERLWFGGHRPKYLSDLDPVAATHQPSFDRSFRHRKDWNIDGGPLRIGRRWYRKGIGTRARTRLTYRLDGKYRWFLAEIGIDEAVGDGGNADFIIRTDEREAFRRTGVTGRDDAILVHVRLDGVRELTLVVDYGQRGDVGDYGDWADAMLIR